ncbi:VWA domain-containing protein, partial [Streptomyces sp. NPDC005402]|uniref:VWA domain-containing protein n=1 Tax=Streptomyces sp. NPDC005402 TaxID=3155338 RepID=UPI0033B76976
PDAEKPVVKEPVAQEPDAEKPVVKEPVAQEPVVEEPVAQEQVAVAVSEKAAPKEPVSKKAAPDAPASEETAPEEPVAEAEPAAETEATAQEPEEPAAVEEAEPTVEPEPEAAAEPETTVEPEPAAEVAAPDAEPEAAPESETVVPPKTEPQPTAEVTAAAAAGEDAPQGAPAGDDETVTGGGAGGNTKAVPPTLRTAYDAAEATLSAHNLTGTTAKTYLVLDRSASMRPYYKDGSAQALGEQTLALAAHLDPEAEVHVVFFSTELDGTGELTLTDHENKIDDLHAGLGRMGRTSYHAAVEEVLAHHTKESPDAPALVVFQTDGAPDAKTPATQALTEAAKTHPGVFFSFVAFGDPENKAFDYLRKLKLANTSHFLAGATPKELTDAEIYEGILADWRP